jgi:hypothetical protein
MTDVTKAQAIAILWRKGVLSWKLDPVQKDLYESYHHASHKTIVWSCSRRLGKSYALCTIAIEKCIQKPNSVVKYIAPTRRHVKMIIGPIMKQLLEDCPKGLRPNISKAEDIYRFPNGSEIQMAGTDQGHAESLRGGSSDICIVDEAGFCDDLRYIVQSILIPTTTTTRGKVILSSTPPKESDHEFVNYMKQAEYRGSFVKKTIYDAIGPRITKEIIQEIIEELGGEESIDFRREYMCEMVIDEDTAVVPEFTEQMQKAIIRDWARPVYYDGYVAGDIGFKDLSVFLFAYYDFRAAKLIIEDELVMSGKKMTTEFLAQGIREKEHINFVDAHSGAIQEPYLRVCDNNLIVINDLYQLHKLSFMPTEKDDASAALNNMRVKLKEGSIIINPRCKTLIYHLRHATWNKRKTSYARSPDAGHYDAVDALKYLVRNVQWTKNPYPFDYRGKSSDDWFIPEKAVKDDPKYQGFKSIFKPKWANKVNK